MDLFAREGYDEVTIETICAEADVAKATFFLHFKSKAALVVAFNDELSQELATRLDEFEGGAEARLNFALAFLVEAWQQNAAVLRKMVQEFSYQADWRQEAAVATQGLMSLVTRIIADGQAAGEFRQGFSPALAAAAVITTWSVTTSWWSESDVDSDRINREFLDIALNGIKASSEG